jgi:hypothetical protein
MVSREKSLASLLFGIDQFQAINVSLGKCPAHG